MKREGTQNGKTQLSHKGTTVSFLFNTDLHFAPRAPGRRQGSYLQDLTVKYQQVNEQARQLDAHQILGGDVFHLKDPEKAPHWFIVQLAQLFREAHSGITTATGNHDITFDRLNTLPGQPLGVLTASQVLYNLTPYTPNIDGKDPLYKEFQGKNGTVEVPQHMTYTQVRVDAGRERPTIINIVGCPYMDDPAELLTYLQSPDFHSTLNETKPTEDCELAVILVLHALASADGADFFGHKRLTYQEIYDAVTSSPVGTALCAVLLGHEHSDSPEYMISHTPDTHQRAQENGILPATGGVIFANPASFSRSALDYDGDPTTPDRPVYTLHLELTTAPGPNGWLMQAKRLPLKTRPLVCVYGTRKRKDLLNQEDAPEQEDTPLEWSDFRAAFNRLDNQSLDPHSLLTKILEKETPKVADKVTELVNLNEPPTATSR
jgi:hypothetical protein